MEAEIEWYVTRHMDLNMEILLEFPVRVAELVRKLVEEADSFRQECADLSSKVEKLIQLLRAAARKVGLYERPTRRIMLEVMKALERALGLVKKCKRGGMLKRVMTITTTADFKKVIMYMDSAIGDITWLLNVSSTGDERSGAGLPPIASTDPMLALVWEQVSIVHAGTPEEKAEAAEYLGNLARGNERNTKIIIEEGGAAPLLRLLKEGTIAGQEGAATTLGYLAGNKERVRQLRTDGAISVFAHILSSHATSMKVQLKVAAAVAKFAELDDEAQSELASQGAIRLLVALLAHQTNTVEGADNPVSIHAVVRTSMSQLKSTAIKGNNSQYDSRVQPVAMAASSVMARMRSAAPPSIAENPSSSSARMNVPLRQSSRAHRDLEDPAVKFQIKVEAANALWKLAAGNIKNCKLITDTCALLCFAKFMKLSGGELKYNSVMAVKEIAAAAERDPELRRAAFKTNSPSARAVVEQLLKEITNENGEPELQVACCKAIGSLARIFPSPAELPIRALTSALANQNQDAIQVATEAASALSKFASDENYLHLEHSKNIIQEGAVEHLVLLALNFGYSESQLSAIELLCYLSLNVPDSESLASANIIHVLKSTVHANQLSQLFAKHENARPLIMDAIAKLEFWQLRSSSFTVDIGHDRSDYMDE
ncbi:uncharacterized protein [Physcomitrium patens]|uniref:DUF7792 domain-containing protein n=1 Tax=Physcomitrium patens TaxID=3218 RepID=A0A2K1L0S5_PHYPA|nr:uncharacterized protein LOC112293537 [Physcomitrium patens]PNR59628.1 hypothetical protein PHYPA_002420 [Physcomitrium patens]|eukprot:XP_024398845.1 uncharacterized protein LOC112293537 [Physcomitrella patens]